MGTCWSPLAYDQDPADGARVTQRRRIPHVLFSGSAMTPGSSSPFLGMRRRGTLHPGFILERLQEQARNPDELRRDLLWRTRSLGMQREGGGSNTRAPRDSEFTNGGARGGRLTYGSHWSVSPQMSHGGSLVKVLTHRPHAVSVGGCWLPILGRAGVRDKKKEVGRASGGVRPSARFVSFFF